MATVINRLALLRTYIDNLSNDDRGLLKRELRNKASVAINKAKADMQAITPERKDDEETYKYRQMGWNSDRYGEQSYLITKSPYPAIRQHGMTLKDGWSYSSPGSREIDFIGSTKNFIEMSTSIENTAPHSKLALLGEYNKYSWNIPNNGLEGGRKAMLWSFNSRPIFRWVHANFSGRSSFIGPVTVTRPSPLTYIVRRGERTLEGYRRDFEDIIYKYFSSAEIR